MSSKRVVRKPGSSASAQPIEHASRPRRNAQDIYKDLYEVIARRQAVQPPFAQFDIEALLDLAETEQGDHVHQLAWNAIALDECEKVLDRAQDLKKSSKSGASFARKLVPPLMTWEDLEFFVKSTVYPTVRFSRQATIQELVHNYAMEDGDLKPDLQHLETLSQSFYRPDAICRWTDSSARHCGMAIGEHLRGTLQAHAGPSTTVCLWDGCDFGIHPTDVARQKGLMIYHVAMVHFRIIPVCSMCPSNLFRPPNLPPKKLPYTLAEHFASGWCIGLAACAMEYGKPVISPRIVQ